jgi:hypothetical protein
MFSNSIIYFKNIYIGENIMGYKNKEELVNGITAYSEYFKYAVPKCFPVYSDYLIDNLGESDFCRCYEIYRQKMLAI